MGIIFPFHLHGANYVVDKNC